MKNVSINTSQFQQENLEKAAKANLWSLAELILELITPRFTISDVGITHRWITHWDKEGLIDNKRSGKEWRKFSFVEYIWLKIISRLRDFNMPLSSIKQVRKYLFQPVSSEQLNNIVNVTIDSFNTGKINLPPDLTVADFEKEMQAAFKDKKIIRLFNTIFFMCLYNLSSRKDSCLLITENGSCSELLFPDNDSIEKNLKAIFNKIQNEDFTVINLYRIFEEFFGNEKIKENVIEKVAVLTDKEKKIIELIRKNDFKELSIKLKDNKQYAIGIKRKKSVDTITNEVSSIINRKKYQDIKLTTQKGKIINAEITDKLVI